MKELKIQETTLRIHVVSVGNSKMTKAVFDQIIRLNALPKKAEVLGYVLITTGKEKGFNWLLNVNGKPYRIHKSDLMIEPEERNREFYGVDGERTFEESTALYLAERALLVGAPQLFIAV